MSRRDQHLIALAALAVVGLIVALFIQPPAQTPIVSTLGAIAVAAVSRISGSAPPPAV